MRSYKLSVQELSFQYRKSVILCTRSSRSSDKRDHCSR